MVSDKTRGGLHTGLVIYLTIDTHLGRLAKLAGFWFPVEDMIVCCVGCWFVCEWDVKCDVFGRQWMKIREGEREPEFL